MPLDYFPYFPCMDYVKVEETRKVLEKVSVDTDAHPAISTACVKKKKRTRTLEGGDVAQRRRRI